MSIDATVPATRTWRVARWWHGATALVAAAALVAQFFVTLNGEADTAAVRVVRYFSYFTILTNTAVCVVSAMLARRPDRDGPIFRVARLDALICITLGGLVHYTLLRPLPEIQNLTGWAQACDIGLHIIVPILAFVGWLLFGPRPRISPRVIWWSVVAPIAWLVYTLIRGEVADWYPYPFVDVAEHGYGRVLLNCVGVAVLFLGCGFLALLADRRLRPAPTAEG